MANHYGNHRCLEEKNDLIAYTLSNRGQDGAYGLGIETTSFSCLKVTMFLIKSRTSKCIHPQHPTDGMAVMNVSNKAGDQFVSFLLLLLRVHYPVGATEQNRTERTKNLDWRKEHFLRCLSYAAINSSWGERILRIVIWQESRSVIKTCFQLFL